MNLDRLLDRYDGWRPSTALRPWTFEKTDSQLVMAAFTAIVFS